MFKRFCSLQPIEVYQSANDMLKGWFGFNRQASANIIKQFEFNPKEFLYYRNRAITADVPNENGDCFERQELLASYPTFIGKGTFYNHASDDPNNSFGVILDANFVQPAGENAYVELLGAIDRRLAEQKHPGLVRRIETGMLSGTSMGCFLAGTNITMKSGIVKAIEDIKAGDEVITHTGSVHKVVTPMTRDYNGDIITLQIPGLESDISMTLEHPVLILKYKCQCGCGEYLPNYEKNGGLNRNKFISGHHKKFINVFNGRKENSLEVLNDLSKVNTKAYVWVKAEELKEGDIVVLPKYKTSKTITVSNTLAKLYGYFIAEGSFLKHKGEVTTVCWTFNINESTTLAKDVLECIKKEFKIDAKSYIRYDKNTIEIRLNNKKIAQQFKEACGEYSTGKHLPYNVLDWNIESQKSLLGAYFDGDGCWKEEKITSATVSEELNSQLKMLCTSLGIRYNTRIVDVKDIHQKAFYLTTYKHDTEELINYSFKIQATEKNSNVGISWFEDNFLCRRISKITRLHYEGPVYNMEIEGDNSYIANDIAVHNCLAGAAKCGICGNYATSLEQLCDHMNPNSPGYVKGKLINASNNQYGFEYNYNITFIEDSIVDTPADHTAQIFEVFASNKDKLDPQNPSKEVIDTLVSALNAMVRNIK